MKDSYRGNKDECEGKKLLYLKADSLIPMGYFIANHHEKEIVITSKGIYCPQCEAFLSIDFSEYSQKKFDRRWND